MSEAGQAPGLVRAVGQEPIFGHGDGVRVATRAPVGHYRVPIYLRGKTGRVEAVIEPAGIDNEEESFGRNAGRRVARMTGTEDLLKRLPNDIGGEAAGPIERVEHELQPWEKRCHALADVLDFHKIINTEEKRRGVEALGSDLIAKLTYYERWIAAFANILFQKGILTPQDLARKMDEVEARGRASAGETR
jgi:hypothetical protein